VTRTASVADLVERARDGQARAVARLISYVEDASPVLREVTAALAPYAGRAHVVGLTGAPGVGKSTSTSALVAVYRERGLRVGVLAVDPSSPFSGGALLGDRVRMQEHATDPMVFIRSMASRGHLGGLASATPQAVRVLDAAGCDIVLVETVGVGQSEVEVAAAADTTVVLLAPGMGDGVQAAKAGILEIGDVFVVNKADRDGADATMRELRHMITLGSGPRSGPAGDTWAPPVLATVAARAEGTRELVDALHAHHAWLERTGELTTRRRQRAAVEVEAIAFGVLRERIGVLHGDARLDSLAARVARGELDPYAAADTLVAGLAL
jgi:LAO/AO transport system kinase